MPFGRVASLGSFLIMSLLGCDTNMACPRKVHGDLVVPWLVAASLGIVVWSVGSLESKRGTCGCGNLNRVRVALPIVPVRLSIDAQYGVSAGISRMAVAGVADITSGDRVVR